MRARVANKAPLPHSALAPNSMPNNAPPSPLSYPTAGAGACPHPHHQQPVRPPIHCPPLLLQPLYSAMPLVLAPALISDPAKLLAASLLSGSSSGHGGSHGDSSSGLGSLLASGLGILQKGPVGVASDATEVTSSPYLPVSLPDAVHVVSLYALFPLPPLRPLHFPGPCRGPGSAAGHLTAPALPGAAAQAGSAAGECRSQLKAPFAPDATT